MLFFQCMAAFFNPVHRRREGVLSGLVSYTVVIFSLVTVLAAINLDILSVSCIDNREFPGRGALVPLGPFGYQVVVDPKALTVILGVIFLWNNLLADGFLVGCLFGPTSPTQVANAALLLVLPFPCSLLHRNLGRRPPLGYRLVCSVRI